MHGNLVKLITSKWRINANLAVTLSDLNDFNNRLVTGEKVMDVKLGAAKQSQSNTYAPSKLPSVALDSGGPKSE